MNNLRTAITIMILCAAFMCAPQSADQVLAADEVHVSDYAGLKTCIEKVNNGEISADTDIFIDADIEVPAEVGNDWIPLAKDAAHAYQGTLNGNGHTISRIHINRTYPDPWKKGTEVNNFTAFISFLGESGNVRDLSIKADINDVNEVAGIVSQNHGMIENCTFEGNLTSNAYPNEWDKHPFDQNNTYFADDNSDSGCIAAVNAGTITGCRAGSSETLGKEKGTTLQRGGDHTGGITGYQIDGGTITNCENYASITTCSSAYKVDGEYTNAGGIAGVQELITADPAKRPSITGCANYGTIYGDLAIAGICGNSFGGNITDCLNEGNILGAERGAVGGIVSYFEPEDNTPTSLSGCVNHGDIIPVTNKVDHVGGIAGQVRDHVSGDMELTPVQVFNCKNTGTVRGTDRVGGVIGMLEQFDVDNTKIYNLVNLGSVTGAAGVGGVIGGCSAILTESINFGTVTIIDVPCDNDPVIGGIAGNLEPGGVVFESYNLGEIRKEKADMKVLAGGIGGSCNFLMTGSYYCMDTAGIAKSANGYFPNDSAGALALKEMTGQAATENMKDMFEHKSGYGNGTVWHTTEDIARDGTYYAMTPQFDEIPISLDEIIAAGVDTSYKLKSTLSSQTKVIPLKTKYAYTGKAITPSVKVMYRGKEIKSGNDYRIYSCFNNRSVGKATVIILGTGQYCDAAKGTFTIVPAKAGLAKIVPGKKKLAVTMSKKAGKYGGSAFQIQYRVKGSAKWKSLTTSKQSATIKKLKSGKTYQVRARVFKKASGTTYYGAWSKVRLTKKIK